MALWDKVKTAIVDLFGRDPPEDPKPVPGQDLKGMPGQVQRLIDNSAAAAAKKIWRAMIHSIGSGLGKGIIIAAALIIGATAIGAGFEVAAAGGLFMSGVGSGIGLGLKALFVGAGPAILGIGGLLGALMEIHQNQNKISAEVAKAEAVAFESLRTQSQPARSQELADFNFAAREMAKRDVAQQPLRK
jgi:hypothetical protein